MKLDLTPQEARVIYRALSDFMDDSANSEEDLEAAGAISFIIKENLPKRKYRK